MDVKVAWCERVTSLYVPDASTWILLPVICRIYSSKHCCVCGVIFAIARFSSLVKLILTLIGFTMALLMRPYGTTFCSLDGFVRGEGWR